MKQGMESLGLVVLAAVMIGLLLPATGQASLKASQVPAGQSGTTVHTSGSPGTAQAAKPTPYIVGGTETTFESHPWLVQITLNGQAFCGGALVHPRLILTAAHCLWTDDPNNGGPNWWAGIGNMQFFTSRTITGTGGEELQWGYQGVAANYMSLDSGGSGENDWGLIALASPSSRPVLKIAGSDERALWKPGRTGTVAGFGNIQFGGPASQTLKEVNEPIVSDSVCGSPEVYGTSFRVANMLCAGMMQGGAGTCQGDSGGPLTVAADGGGRRIAGVVSWADNCAKPNKPTVFTRVAEPGVSAQINAMAAELGQAANFPGVDANTNLLGSGARPVGCSAAQAAAASAQAGVAAAGEKVKSAKKSFSKARRKAKKARAKVNRAKRQVKKTRGRKKAKAKKALRRANKANKKARRSLNKAKAVDRKARSGLNAARSNAQAAEATANSTCN